MFTKDCRISPVIQHNFTSEGFILGRRDFGEADRIIDIYSKDYGKISVIAKGVRRPTSRKRGHLEIFGKIKFQAVNGKGMGIITEAETIDDFKQIRSSMKKISLAYYFMEVVSKSMEKDEPNIDVYDLLCEYMNTLKVTKALMHYRKKFVEELLKTLGYWPKDKDLPFPDEKLEEVLERQIYSKRVGKIMLE